jgi:replicative DNA helicase Mcm
VTLQEDLGDSFVDFLSNFVDDKGRKKYLEALREVVATRRRSLYVDFPDLLTHNVDLASRIVEKPRVMLPALEERLTLVARGIDEDYTSSVRRVHLRFTELSNSFNLRNIRSTEVGKLISVEGIIVKSTPIKERVQRALFKHLECGAEFEWPEGGEVGEFLEMPSQCPLCRKGGHFRLLTEKSEMVDWQRAIIQERPEEVPPGQLPRQMEVIMEDDLVDSTRPGDRAKVVGILDVKQESGIRRGMRPIFDLFMRANSVEVSQKVLDEVLISPEDEQRIRRLSEDPWIVDKVVASIAPSIYGHWEIKEAIALSLFGGEPKSLPDGTKLRGDIHVLVVGDPGTAKSQMLQFTSRVAPRAIYTTGKGSTAAGLTAAVVRDKQSGDFFLEAGAMVIADGGVAVIDEIDKMREEDRVAIHEAMEQQTVSIAKAGIVAKLNARAAVVAAGNPKFGRYIQERGVAENINLPATILSRFDLIFILRDKPGETDSLLASHILGSHSGKAGIPPIQIELLKKYIAFARKFVHPVLSDEAKQLLLDFFVEMRRRGEESQDSPIAITARQLEALIRISEAYARMSLRNVVLKQDAERAVNLVRVFLERVGIDMESGKIDIDVLMTGKPKSVRDRTVKILEIIEDLSGDECAKLKEILEEASREGIEQKQAERIILELRRNGEIFEKSQNCYRKV